MATRAKNQTPNDPIARVQRDYLDEAVPVNEQTPVVQPVDDQALIDEQMTVDTDAAQAADELERLRAEQVATRERIKQLEAKAPKATDLEKVNAKQRDDQGGKWAYISLYKRVNARVQAGQSFDAALDEVLHQYRVLLSAPDAAERAKALENERKGSDAAKAHIADLAATRATTGK